MTNERKSCTLPFQIKKVGVSKVDTSAIEKLASKYQEKADKDFRNYQDSGIKRYLYSYHKNEELAVALRLASGAADEHQAYIALKLKLSEFIQRAQRINSTPIDFEKEIMTNSLIEDLIHYGRLEGLIREL